ncbi:hypothetical protein DWB61_17250, partial [Ancylomarina euxinus]
SSFKPQSKLVKQLVYNKTGKSIKAEMATRLPASAITNQLTVTVLLSCVGDLKCCPFKPLGSKPHKFVYIF